jgi:hypothetical protein
MITDVKVFDGVKESHALEGMPTINDANYYDDRSYITNSMLGKLNEHPSVLQEYLEGGRGISSSSLSMGDAVHKGMLEPEKYESMVVTWSKSQWPERDKTLRTKANREWLNAFKEQHEGKCILEDSEFIEVQGMIDSIKKKPDAIKWLDDAQYEHIALAKIAGVPVKSKGDIIKNGNEWAIDIKTSSDASIEGFKESCAKYGYYRQAGMYSKMFNVKRFAFLVVEKKAPYKVAFYEVSQEKLEQGWKETLDLIEKYKYFFVDDPLQFRVSEAVITGVL